MHVSLYVYVRLCADACAHIICGREEFIFCATLVWRAELNRVWNGKLDPEVDVRGMDGNQAKKGKLVSYLNAALHRV